MTIRRPAVVTGGAGFIGSHMVDLLLGEGIPVRVIDSLAGGRERNLDHLKGEGKLALEVRDIRTIEPGDSVFTGAEMVFHFAGIGDIVPSIDRPTEYLDVNVQGTVRVLEAARAAGIENLVYAASSSCYGIASVPTSEDHPVRPQYPYALSKYLGEQACLHWHQVYGLPVKSIRIFNAFGPRSRTTGAYGAVFGVFLRQKLEGVPYTVVGDGTQRRDFVFVTDVARAFFLAATRGQPGDVFNVGSSRPMSINTLVEILGGPVDYLPSRPGEPDCTWADISKIERTLGWSPTVSFEEGVRTMLAEIHNWKDAPLWDKDSISEATRSWYKYLAKSGN